MTFTFAMSPAMSGMSGLSGMLPVVGGEDPPDPPVVANDLAMTFDQPSFARSTGDPIPLTYPFSLVAWIKTTDTTSNIRTIFSVGDSDTQYSGLHVNGGNFIARSLYSPDSNVTDGGGAAQVIADNTWHMVGVVVRNTNLQGFRDGVFLATPSEHSLTIPNTHAVCGVLARPTGTTNSLYGSSLGDIDECMVFNDELDATDLTELWANGVGVLSNSLINESAALTSGRKPIHAFPLNANHASGRTFDVGTTGGHTLVESGAGIANATGIAAGTPA